MIKRLIMDEQGQALSEYGLVLGVVVVASIAVLTTFKDDLGKLFGKINTAISGVAN